jgi:hypothetical protein
MVAGVDLNRRPLGKRSDSPLNESPTKPSPTHVARHPVSTPSPTFLGLGSVLPYRSHDVGFTDFDK